MEYSSARPFAIGAGIDLTLPGAYTPPLVTVLLPPNYIHSRSEDPLSFFFLFLLFFCWRVEDD